MGPAEAPGLEVTHPEVGLFAGYEGMEASIAWSDSWGAPGYAPFPDPYANPLLQPQALHDQQQDPLGPFGPPDLGPFGPGGMHL